MDPEYLADAHQDPHTVTNEAIRLFQMACKDRPDNWPLFYESDAITPAATIGHLRLLLALAERADAAEAEAKALREAVMKALTSTAGRDYLLIDLAADAGFTADDLLPPRLSQLAHEAECEAAALAVLSERKKLARATLAQSAADGGK